MPHTMRGPDEQSPAQEAALTLQQLPERIRDIATLRGLGYSYRKIADGFGVTPQAVSVMLSRHRHSLADLRRHPEFAELSPRAVNALAKHGIRSRAEAHGRNVSDLLQGQRNCGRKTLEEIARWLDRAEAPRKDAQASPEPGQIAGVQPPVFT